MLKSGATASVVIHRFQSLALSAFRSEATHLSKYQFSQHSNSTSLGDNISLMSIFVGNLPYEVTQDDLQQVFAEYGTVQRIHMPMDRDTGRMRGFAFVDLGADTEEDSAISELNQAEWMGRTLKVDKARPRQESGGNGGGRRERFSSRF